MSNKNQVTLIQTIGNSRALIIEKFGSKIGRSLQVTGAIGFANILISMGKLLMGIVSLSFFTCVNAFYSFGMVIAKYCALVGIIRAKNRKEEYGYYMFSGIILITASIMYIIYSVKLFYNPVPSRYHMYVALGIATVTFIEITLNIRGIIRERNNHTPLIHAIKMINLASSLISLVLTQTAILSFASTEGEKVHSMANGLTGVIMGGIATLLGIIMIYRIRKIEKGKNYGFAYRNMKKLMKKQGMALKMKAVKYEEDEIKGRKLYVILSEAVKEKDFINLQKEVKEQLELELLDAATIQNNNHNKC